MRWSEIHEALQHAQPLAMRKAGGLKKANALIPVVGTDPLTAMVQGIASQVSGQAAQQAVAADDAQEAQLAQQQALQQQTQEQAGSEAKQHQINQLRNKVTK